MSDYEFRRLCRWLKIDPITLRPLHRWPWR